MKLPTCCDRFSDEETPLETPGAKKTERGERELSFEYRIVENDQGEEELDMCDVRGRAR